MSIRPLLNAGHYNFAASSMLNGPQIGMKRFTLVAVAHLIPGRDAAVEYLYCHLSYIHCVSPPLELRPVVGYIGYLHMANEF